jgi:hypothetical protein
VAGQAPEAGDFLGTAIVAGRVDRDPSADLLIATPGKGAEAGPEPGTTEPTPPGS